MAARVQTRRTQAPRTLSEWAETIGRQQGEDHVDLAEIRRLVGLAVTDPHLQARLLQVGLRDGRVRRSRLFVDPESGVTAVLFYWPPGYHSPRHLHRGWTVSGVLFGDVEVRRYASTTDIDAEARLIAGFGDVGGIDPPGVHSVGNPSNDLPAITLSLFGPRVDNDTTWLSGDIAPPLVDGRKVKLWASLEAAAKHPESAPHRDLAAAVFEMGSARMKRRAFNVLVQSDPVRAMSMVDALDAAERQGLTGVQPASPSQHERNSAMVKKAKKSPTLAEVRAKNLAAGRNLDSKRARKILRRAEKFDLEHVVARYRKDHGVKKKAARLHERELRRYLALAALHPDRPLGMAGQVDKLWHTFLLFTRDYQRFCLDVAGYMIHHQPTPPSEPKETGRQNYVFFFESYYRVFGELPPASVWPSAASSSGVPSLCAGGICTGDPLCGCTPCGSNPGPVPCDNREPVCESPGEPGGDPICESPVCDNEPICESPVCDNEPICESPVCAAETETA